MADRSNSTLLPKFNRRRVVLGLAAAFAAVPAAVIPAASAAADDDLKQLLRAWRDAYDACSGDKEVGDQVGPLMRRQWDMIDQACAIPARTAEGLAVKILMLTTYGEFELEGERLASVLADAERFVGLPAPTTLAAFRERAAS